MHTTRFSRKLNNAINESQEIFGNLRQVHKSIYDATSHIYSFQVEDPIVHIKELRVITDRLTELLEHLDREADLIEYMRQTFATDEYAPSELNQALAIGYAHMAHRYFHKSYRNALKLDRHVRNYFAVRSLNSLERIQLFAKIYGRFIDTEIWLAKGTFALRIAYNHAVSRIIVEELLEHPLAVRDLQMGDVILSYKSSPYLQHHLLSRLISIAEHENITHSALVYETRGTHVRALAASGDAGRVGVYDIKPARGEYWFVFRPALSAHQHTRLRAALGRWVEEVERNPSAHHFAELKSWVAVLIGYLFAELVLHANVIALVPNIANSDKDYFCSDIIDKIFKEIGIHLVPRSRNDGVIGPAELFYSPYLKHVGIYVNREDVASLTKEKWSV